MAALGITERFDRCICVVVSEESGTLSLASQGRLERPITSSRWLDLLKELLDPSNASGSKSTSINSSLKTTSSNIETKVAQSRGNLVKNNDSKEHLN